MSVQPVANAESTKDLDHQQPIPTCWRRIVDLRTIADVP